MESTSMRRGAALSERVRSIDLAATATWLLSFGLIVYLGLRGGGYDPLVHDQVGIAVWWIALAGVAIGALPRRRPGNLAWIALGLLGAFTLWTALSLEWTESFARTSADLARVAGYLGIFALAVFTRVFREADRLVAAVAAGIAAVTAVALLSRLHPSWFPEAAQTANFISDSRERLSYPINYWNGLAALVAIGIPLLLQMATGSRAVLSRALSAAALPMMAVVAFYTLSRGGIAAAALAVTVYLMLAADRLPKLMTLFSAGAGGAILISAADARNDLQHGLVNATSNRQGDEMLMMVVGVCLIVGLIQVAISFALLGPRRPHWTMVSRRNALVASVAVVVAALGFAVALDAPGRASDGWDEFKQGGGPGSGTDRLDSVAGQSRYQFWSAALDENATKPLTGTGSGTFELWWARNGDTGESVRDTHSLYLQTLGELGVVGFVILISFLLTIFFAGGLAVMRASPPNRSLLAAALAGCAAFCLTAVVDWMWQIPVLPVALLLLASLLVSADPRPEEERRRFSPSMQVGFVAAAILAIVVIAMPLASTNLLRESEADARAGDLDSALEAARTAQNVQPESAAPRLQQALVFEEQGRLMLAASAARAAAEREPTNWRNWLILSRIEAQRGQVDAAMRDFRKAKSLNPHFSHFE